MAQHDPQVIALRRIREQFAEDRDRGVVASEAREYRGAKKSGLGIGRRGPQPLLDLLQRRRIFLALNQDAHEIQPRGGVIRRAVHHFAEKALGPIRCAAPLRDPPEQAQRLDMPSVAERCSSSEGFPPPTCSPSQNQLPASTIAGGSSFSFERCCDATPALCGWPAALSNRSSIAQLDARAGLSSTARSNDSIARAGSPSATWQ